MNQIIGYARVSTFDQNLDLQKDALTKAGCHRIFEDKASGAKDNRPGLNQALDFIREGDTLVVWKLDRLGRSHQHLTETVRGLNEQKINFISLQESIDTTSSSGKLTFHLFCALAEFGLDIIRERTQAGLAAARARGRLGGRPKLMNTKKLELAKSMHANKNISIKEIYETLKISRTTLYRYLKNNL